LLALDAAGARSVRSYVSEGTALDRELGEFGVRRRTGHFDVSIIPLDDGRSYSSLADPCRWRAMPGDFDVY